MPWTNAPAKLYHGTLGIWANVIESGGIDLTNLIGTKILSKVSTQFLFSIKLLTSPIVNTRPFNRDGRLVGGGMILFVRQS
jgi:hypothetical protein